MSVISYLIDRVNAPDLRARLSEEVARMQTKDSLAEITAAQASVIYAEEADVLNVAMFGMTAKQWREANPELKGNIRDYATINELICLSNMENINAVLINDGMLQGERLVKLNQIAIQQMQVLEGNSNRELLK